MAQRAVHAPEATIMPGQGTLLMHTPAGNVTNIHASKGTLAALKVAPVVGGKSKVRPIMKRKAPAASRSDSTPGFQTDSKRMRV